MPIDTTDAEARHTEDMQDIITAVPSWILRWGITVFFVVLVLIFSLSALICYPDIVNASLKIVSPNSPKPVVAKISGKLTRLLVHNNEIVNTGQALAYLESTGDHKAVLELNANLRLIQAQLLSGKPFSEDMSRQASLSQLGELQPSYQSFYQQYLDYHSAISNGFYLKKRNYLEKDLLNLVQQRDQLNEQKTLEQKDYVLAQQEYEMHQKLVSQKVEAASEFRSQESKYLSKKAPLVQTEAALLSAGSNYAAKQKEILELDDQITQARSKFLQALNSLISQCDDWKSKYVLIASQGGKLSFAGIIQEDQQLSPNQEVFYINPGNEQFFGEMNIPQTSMGKVKDGQQVLLKLRSYPYEEYGMLRGRIKYIADVPYRDSIFVSQVAIDIKNTSDLKKPIHLKNGMNADAEIITQDATILQRITWNLFKLIDK